MFRSEIHKKLTFSLPIIFFLAFGISANAFAGGELEGGDPSDPNGGGGAPVVPAEQSATDSTVSSQQATANNAVQNQVKEINKSSETARLDASDKLARPEDLVNRFELRQVRRNQNEPGAKLSTTKVTNYEGTVSVEFLGDRGGFNPFQRRGSESYPTEDCAGRNRRDETFSKDGVGGRLTQGAKV